MAQRLVRRVCPACNKRAASSSQEAPAGVPCANCGGTGYRGRMGIFELLVLDDDFRELILVDARAHKIMQLAVSKGMCSLRDDGLQKMARGLTTPEEVFRVTQEDSDGDPPRSDDDGAV